MRQTLERLNVAALLQHPGEVGRAREQALRDHLQSFLPPAIGISTGFVIDAHGGRSRQIDLIIHFADYHAVFMVNEIPLIPVEAVIAVFEIKSAVRDRRVLHDCYDVLRSVKRLDRSNGGRNVRLVHTQAHEVSPEAWRHFQFQVFGAVIAVESCTDALWLESTYDWCELNEAHLWPNFYCAANDYIGTYHTPVLGATPNHTTAANLVVFPTEGQTPLAWATQEILNFVRVAQRIDYLPTSYMSAHAGAVSVKWRPLPRITS